jgi:hypothetical protein
MGNRGHVTGSGLPLLVKLRRVLLAGAVGAAGYCLVLAAPALAAAPTVATGVASAVTYQSATLAGTVNPGGHSTEVYFQYGTTSKFGAQSAPTELPIGTTAVAISIPIAGLSAGTAYHYRIVATNVTATTLGSDKSFTTARIPLSLAITAAPNPVSFGGAITVEGTLSGTGNANAAVQLQQTPFPYTAAFSNVGNPELTLANGTFVVNVLDVTMNTQYRVVSGGVASPAVLVSDSLGVALYARATGTRKRPTVRFSGTIDPAEQSARIAFERLVGTSWKVISGTVAAGTIVNGVVSFAKTVRVYHSGFFRALVLPVEGAHVSGYSQTVVVRIK